MSEELPPDPFSAFMIAMSGVHAMILQALMREGIVWPNDLASFVAENGKKYGEHRERG